MFSGRLTFKTPREHFVSYFLNAPMNRTFSRFFFNFFGQKPTRLPLESRNSYAEDHAFELIKVTFSQIPLGRLCMTACWFLQWHQSRA